MDPWSSVLWLTAKDPVIGSGLERLIQPWHCLAVGDLIRPMRSCPAGCAETGAGGQDAYGPAVQTPQWLFITYLVSLGRVERKTWHRGKNPTAFLRKCPSLHSRNRWELWLCRLSSTLVCHSLFFFFLKSFIAV